MRKTAWSISIHYVHDSDISLKADWCYHWVLASNLLSGNILGTTPEFVGFPDNIEDGRVSRWTHRVVARARKPELAEKKNSLTVCAARELGKFRKSKSGLSFAAEQAKAKQT